MRIRYSNTCTNTPEAVLKLFSSCYDMYCFVSMTSKFGYNDREFIIIRRVHITFITFSSLAYTKKKEKKSNRQQHVRAHSVTVIVLRPIVPSHQSAAPELVEDDQGCCCGVPKKEDEEHQG